MLIQEAVAALRPLQHDVWPLLRHAGEEPPIHPTRFIGKDAFDHFDASTPQSFDTLAIHLGEGIVMRDNHALHAALNDQISARWCSTVVRARLKAYIQDGILGHR